MSVAEMIRGLLQGEPLRVISYGSIAVVWLVTHVAYATGLTHNQPPDLDAVLGAVSGAAVLVTEGARMFVYSPNTVARLVSEASVGGPDTP